MLKNIFNLTAKEFRVWVTNSRRDFYRAVAMAGIIFYVFKTDPQGINVITYMLCIMAIVALFSHFVRRMLFPYLDMRILMEDAQRNKSLPSALIFLGICFIVGMMILSVGGMLQ